MAQVIPFERYIRREEATEASTALEIEKIPKSITDEVFKKLGSVIGQTVISEQLAPKRAVQPVQPESLYTSDHYFVKIIEIDIREPYEKEGLFVNEPKQRTQ